MSAWTACNSLWTLASDSSTSCLKPGMKEPNDAEMAAWTDALSWACMRSSISSRADLRTTGSSPGSGASGAGRFEVVLEEELASS
eukprot:5106508-Alexandrium_andersonii.AAC.1